MQRTTAGSGTGFLPYLASLIIDSIPYLSEKTGDSHFAEYDDTGHSHAYAINKNI